MNDGDRLCEFVDLVEDPVAPDAQALDLGRAVRDSGGGSRLVGECVDSVEDLTTPPVSSRRNPAVRSTAVVSQLMA